MEEGVRAILEDPQGVNAVLDHAKIDGVDSSRHRQWHAAVIVAVPDVDQRAVSRVHDIEGLVLVDSPVRPGHASQQHQGA